MPIISMDYEYNLPNNFLVDHSFSEGKKRETTYDGPDRIYLIINNKTGKEEFGPVTDQDLADGRPIPEGCRYVAVDCTENPLLCQLRAPVIDEQEEDHTGDMLHPECVPVAGYPEVRYQTPILPYNIYDKLNVSVDEHNNITIPVKTVVQEMFGGAFDTMPTWDYVKKQRNYRLQHSDGKVTDDMPADLKTKWATYRQRLRDLPTALAANPPYIALQMFPLSPDDEIMPE